MMRFYLYDQNVLILSYSVLVKKSQTNIEFTVPFEFHVLATAVKDRMLFMMALCELSSFWRS